MALPHIPTFALAWLLGMSAIAAYTDARAGLIPNWLTLPTLLLAPLAALASDGATGLAGSLAGAVLCAAVPLAMFGLRAIGGGDVKLFAAIGALCGASTGLELQLTSYVLAAVGALLLAARRGVLWATLLTALRLLLPRRLRDAERPAASDSLTAVRLGIYVLGAALWLSVRDVLGAP